MVEEFVFGDVNITIRRGENEVPIAGPTRVPDVEMLIEVTDENGIEVITVPMTFEAARSIAADLLAVAEEAAPAQT
jgi:uncharacterized protein (UPF0261 family)